MRVSRALARVLTPANLPMQPLYGGRLGWGSGALKRGFNGLSLGVKACYNQQVDGQGALKRGGEQLIIDGASC